MIAKVFPHRLWLMVIFLLVFMAAVCAVGIARGEAREAKDKTASNHRRLFLDDQEIAEMHNLTRTMHPPVKKGAVIRPNPSITLNAIQTRTAPIWDPQDKVFKFWTYSNPNDLHAKDIYCGGYHQSKDGLHWSQPILRQIDHRGSLENHFVSVMIDGKPFRPDCVICDPMESDPGTRYKGLAYVHGKLQPIVSADGKAWKKLNAPPIATGDEFNLSFDEGEKRFIATVKRGGRYGRAAQIFTSQDCQKWTPSGGFQADEEDQVRGRTNIKARLADPRLQQAVWNDAAAYNVDVYNMAVFRYEGLYVGMPAMYHATGPIPMVGNTDGFHLVQLACSRDLEHWKRLGERQPFIGPSPRGAGAYDLTQIIAPSAPVVRGDELWFYYTGLKYRSRPKDAEPDAGAICLAVLRRDGFVSLDAGKEEGFVLTKPFALPNGDLHLNVNANEGSIVVQVCDEKGLLVPGFTASSVTGDHLDAVVSWPKADLGKLAGKTVCLRFSLRQALLYSYWFYSKNKEVPEREP